MIIAICDDDRIWLQSARERIHNYTTEVGIDAKILTFQTSDDLLTHEGHPVDAVFLDINLKDQQADGIDIAKQINSKWEFCQIVFVTNHIHYAMDVYESVHSYFVTKEQFADRLGVIFQHILDHQEQRRKSLLFVCIGKDIVKLAPEEIYYFERKDRKTYLFTVWGSYELYDRIDDLEERLACENFVRCHNSFLVYAPNIRKMKGNAFYMPDGQIITISRRYQKTAKQAFTRWVLSQVR